MHDELVLEVVKEAMEGAVQLDVPLAAEMGAGPNWMAAKSSQDEQPASA